jgi:hypothetical protein
MGRSVKTVIPMVFQHSVTMERVSPCARGSASGGVPHRQIERSFLRLSGVGSGAVGAGDIFYVCPILCERTGGCDMRTPSYLTFTQSAVFGVTLVVYRYRPIAFVVFRLSSPNSF